MLRLSFLFWKVRSLTANILVALSFFDLQPTFLAALTETWASLLTYCSLFPLVNALPPIVVIQSAMAALHCMFHLRMLLPLV